MEATAPLAVEVLSAYKRYDTNWVLKGLNMSVQQSTIYGLLGPSGCGKSTLLNCIVGRQALDSGCIKVQCKMRSQLGYMPQATALYELLSIGEMLRYYGQLVELSLDEISERSAKLAGLLELPPLHRIVETLSGGQQRRVSLAVALLNDPSILILDEPTVGLDPVLSDGIWKHLMKMAKEHNKTVIITTHYIEEARQANIVGLMRGGVLLSESTPQSLLLTQGCDSMEQAFLKLCYVQERNNNINIQRKEPDKIPYGVVQDERPFLQVNSFLSMSCLQAEVRKNAIFIWRNKAMLPFLAFLPLLICLLYNYTIGVFPKDLRLGVVNAEVPDIRMCYGIDQTICNISSPISCRIILKVEEHGYELMTFKTYEEAISSIRSRKLWAIITVPPNFTENLLERFDMNLNTGDHIISHGQIDLWVDKGDYYIFTYLNFIVQQSLINGLASFFNACNWPLETFNVPIKMMHPVYGEEEPNINMSASSSVIIIMVFYLPMSYTIGVLMQEKLSGVLERSMVAGLKVSESFLGHTLIQVIIMVIQILIICFTFYYWFEHPIRGSLVMGVFLMILQGLSGLAFGFLVSIMCNKIVAASYVSIGVTICFTFLSGIIWPQEGLYFGLKWFRPLIPISYSVEALRSIISRDFSIKHFFVWRGFISIFFWMVFYVTIAHYIEKFNRSKRK